MKVELDLDSTQLELLDSNLKDCLLSLTEEQKIKLLQEYINTQLESFRQPKNELNNYWSRQEYEYTDFGREITNNMKECIKAAITEKMLSSEEIQKYMNEVIEEVKSELSNAITSSISKYITDNLFSSKSDIKYLIESTLRSTR